MVSIILFSIYVTLALRAALEPALAISGYLILFSAAFVSTEVFVVGLRVSGFFSISIVFVLKVVIRTNSLALGILFLIVKFLCYCHLFTSPLVSFVMTFHFTSDTCSTNLKESCNS